MVDGLWLEPLIWMMWRWLERENNEQNNWRTNWWKVWWKHRWMDRLKQKLSDKVTEWPTVWLTDQPFDQPTNPPVDRPIDRPTDQPTDQPTDRPTIHSLISDRRNLTSKMISFSVIFVDAFCNSYSMQKIADAMALSWVWRRLFTSFSDRRITIILCVWLNEFQIKMYERIREGIHEFVNEFVN